MPDAMKKAQNTTRFAHAIYCKSSSLPILLTSRNLSEIRQKSPHFLSERVAIVRMEEYVLLRRLATAPTLRVPTKKVPLTKYERQSLVERAMDGYFRGAAGRMGGVEGVLVALGLLPPEPEGSTERRTLQPVVRPTGELPAEPAGSANRRTPAPTHEPAGSPLRPTGEPSNEPGGSTERRTRTNPRVRYKPISAVTAQKIIRSGRREKVQCRFEGGRWMPFTYAGPDKSVELNRWPTSWEWRQVIGGSKK